MLELNRNMFLRSRGQHFIIHDADISGEYLGHAGDGVNCISHFGWLLEAASEARFPRHS